MIDKNRGGLVINVEYKTSPTVSLSFNETVLFDSLQISHNILNTFINWLHFHLEFFIWMEREGSSWCIIIVCL